ncbi:MAG: 3-phosphoshikimate 1-carboxyvinyltransferase [Bacteroidota bacterium]
MSSLLLKHDNSFFSRSFKISGSKSESNRLLVLKSIYQNLNIENLSDSDDSIVLKKYLDNLSENIDIHHAGTAMRFLTALLSVKENKKFEITGSDRMKQRPIGVLVDALKNLGAEITYKDQIGFPPLIISGKKILGGEIFLSAEISSQYITALILIAPMLEKGLIINLQGAIASKPYILMTLSILDKLGIKNKFENNKISVHPCDKIKDITVNVESDWSSVSYFYSIIAISKKSHLEIGSYFKNSIQGDKKLVEIYSKLGVKTEFIENKIFLEKDTECLLPKNLDLDLTENPDIAQTIAVTCFGLGISCNIKGLHTLKIKETDRLVALKNEIEKLGGKIEITDDSLKLYPSFEIKKNISIKTYNDHRMAMAFAPLSLLVPIYIENPDVVTKSYKNFWSDLRAINFEISR